MQSGGRVLFKGRKNSHCITRTTGELSHSKHAWCTSEFWYDLIYRITFTQEYVQGRMVPEFLLSQQGLAVWLYKAKIYPARLKPVEFKDLHEFYCAGENSVFNWNTVLLLHYTNASLLPCSKWGCGWVTPGEPGDELFSGAQAWQMQRTRASTA